MERELGAETLVCPTCGATLPTVIDAIGAVSISACPTCYGVAPVEVAALAAVDTPPADAPTADAGIMVADAQVGDEVHE